MYQIAINKYLEKHGFEAWCPKAVLFDMDGVLYNSMPNHAIAWSQSMEQFGIKMTAEDAYATEGARGVDTIRNMVERQQGKTIDEAEAQRMYEVKSNLFHQLPEAPLMPGIMQLMKQIKDDGKLISVVTGSGQRPLIARLLNDFKEFLDETHLVTAYDVQQGKPHPYPYLTGLKKAGGLKPWEAVVIENAPLGVRAGVAARIFTIAVNTGPLPYDALSGEGADLVFSSIQELNDHWHDLSPKLSL